MRQSYVPVLQIGPEAVFIRHHLFSTFRHMPLLRCDNTREKLLAAQWQGMNFKERLPYILATKMRAHESLSSLDKLTRAELTKSGVSLTKLLSSGKVKSKIAFPFTRKSIKPSTKNQSVNGYKAFIRAQLIILSLCSRERKASGYDLNNLWSHLDIAKHDIEKEFLRLRKGEKAKLLGNDRRLIESSHPMKENNTNPNKDMRSSPNFFSFLNTADTTRKSSLPEQHKKIRSKWFRMSKADRLAW